MKPKLIILSLAACYWGTASAQNKVISVADKKQQAQYQKEGALGAYILGI